MKGFGGPIKRARRLRRRLVLGWYSFATAERRAAWQLLARGFLYRREPGFLAGRKPDFLTCGRGRMWVEVKEFDPPVSQALMDFAWDELTARFSRLFGRCQVDAWISPGFDAKAAKQAAHLLWQETKPGSVAPAGDLYIEVPSGAAAEGIVRIEWRRRDGIDVRLVALRSSDGIYGCPPAAHPADWTAPVRIIEGTTSAQQPAYKVLDVQRLAHVALRVRPPRGGNVLASMGNAEMQRVTTVDRLRDVVDDANEQIKQGQMYRALPGVLIVYFDHIGAGEPTHILQACLGDLTASIDPAGTAITQMFYGRNGVFRPHKNTAISAIVYRSRHYSSVSLMNPFALFPVIRDWLDDGKGAIYWVDSSGTIQSSGTASR